MKIEDLEKALQYFVITVPESEGQAKTYFWARKALTALRSMQEAGEPLSLEQLREMDGQPVWIEDLQTYSLVSVENNGTWEGIPFVVFTENGAKFTCNIEERGLKIYAYPPARIDRSKWEPCDNCKKACWNCKHNLLCCEGNDKECDDCVNQSKWEFLAYQNYCPKCGRPLTKEAWAELERRVMR